MMVAQSNNSANLKLSKENQLEIFVKTDLSQTDTLGKTLAQYIKHNEQNENLVTLLRYKYLLF